MHAKHTETGNVLFMILIAVALFAALSYAVTQSSRGGSSGIEDEKTTIGMGAINEYVTAIRTQALLINARGAEHPDFSNFNNRVSRASDGYTRCTNTPDECIFQTVPFHNLGSRLHNAFPDVGFKSIDELTPTDAGGMTGTAVVVNGRYYNYVLLRQMKAAACATFNERLDLPSLIEVDAFSDFDALTTTELQVPVQCLKIRTEDNYFLAVLVYESDEV